MTQPVVFISYSHKDEAEKEALVSHLGVLAQTGLVDLWDDDQIDAGGAWRDEIDQAMARAKVAILLISANFLTSEFILREELPALLQRREREGLTVFPVIAKACAWQSVDWLTKMNVKPRNGSPVWREAGHYVDQDLAAIAQEVVQIVQGHEAGFGTPFVFDAPVHPDHFVGRSRAVRHIFDQLSPLIRGSSAICGDPRVGKTSLLHYLRTPQVQREWQLDRNAYQFVYLDCHSIIPFSEATFWRYVLRAIGQPLKNDEVLSGRVERLLEQANPEYLDIQDLFDSIARAGRLVVLMLDEFEGVVENLDPSSPVLLYHLRALLNRPRRGLALLVATREQLKQLCTDFRFTGSPFDNSFRAITLPPFSETEIDDLFKQYRIALSGSKRAFLNQIAGTHPYLVQLAGSLIVRSTEPDVNGETDTTEIETEFEQLTEGYFSDLLAYSGERERMLLTWLSLVQLSQHLPATPVSSGNLIDLFDYYPQEIGRLITRGLVVDRPDGPAIFSPVFGKYILYKTLIAEDQEMLSRWEAQLENIMLPSQKEILKDLVDKVIKWPAIIKKPELLTRLYAQDRVDQPTALIYGQDIVGGYVIEEKIGLGGVADVFKGNHPYLDRPAAIKKLRPTFSDDEEQRIRFLREARAIAALAHRHIVQIYDFGIQDNHYFMVMEYIDGDNLQQYMTTLQQADKRVIWAETLRIGGCIAEALDYAHQRNMIHRDVKPSNVLLTADGGVFLTDFGIVRLLDQSETQPDGAVRGTPTHMAPEQVAQTLENDHRVDIYALGCVVYEMIAGRLPFAGEKLVEVMFKHINEPPPPPRRFNPDIPEAVEQLVLEALAKDPEERPSSATKFIEDLRLAFNL